MQVILELPDICAYVHMVCIVDDEEKGATSFMVEFKPKEGKRVYIRMPEGGE